MKTLSSAQRKKLRALAHNLKPVVYVGKAGFTGSLKGAVDDALLAHELIKVKFNDFKDEKQAIGDTIASECEAEIAGLIGNVLILYKEHPEEDQRRIKLD